MNETQAHVARSLKGPRYPSAMRENGEGIVVFDLDGVLAESVWPDRTRIGDPIPEGIAMLQHYAEQSCTIIIDTARREWDKPLIIEWVKKHKLPVDVVLCGRKPAAGLYIDDRGYRFER